MTDQDQSTASLTQLLDGIRKGLVPRQVRLFAAQGLLPIPRESLLRLQVVLTSDPDEELAKIASTSITETKTDVLIEWIRATLLDPLELDLLVRVRREEPIWGAVATNAQVSDETLRVMARHCTPLVQDIIITNQVRVLSCLEILEDLRSNPQASQVVLRRVREFEEEFIEKTAKAAALKEQERLEAAQQEMPDEAEQAGDETLSLEHALAALKAIGGRVPGEEDLPFPADRDPALEKAVDDAGKESAFGKILKMSIKEKILCALKGGREERSILINSRNRLVLNAVLASPKLNDNEVERYAQLRSVSDEVIRIIAANNRYLRQYPIMLALVYNPKTPVQKAIRLLTRLNKRDLQKLTRDRNVPEIVRRRAREFLERLR